MLLPLVCYPDERLLRPVKPTVFPNTRLPQLVSDMQETMDRWGGVGLAACQVGEDLSLFIARFAPVDDYEHWLNLPVEVFVNPEVTILNSKMIAGTEGCLSIPGVHALVKRPFAIKLRAQTVEGEWMDAVYEDYAARIILHETDHLKGVLYTHHLNPAKRQRLLDEYAAKRRG